jgi:glucuronate isomerase
MAFIHDDFLLKTDLARRLYHEVARDLPIIDYHSHLPPADIACNRRFRDLFEIWLEGDHYKWRAMRTNGVTEALCTGDAPARDKFLAWCRTVPQTIRNPLYHWSHIELKRYFGIDDLISEATADSIWERANARLADDDRDVHGILNDFNVEVVCTTDDPADDLQHHRAIAESGLRTKVLPTFRPDTLLRIDEPEFFNGYVERLAAAADTDVSTWAGLQAALTKRHDFFHRMGCRLSDHGLPHAHADFASEATVAGIYDKARLGQIVSPDEKEQFATAVMVLSGRLDAEKGWVKQLHLGPLRNNNTRLFNKIGRDIGCDSIGDAPQAERLSRYLDRLDQDELLPKTILYNINPTDNYLLGTMIGNFQDGSTPGKMQFGSGWWFLDQREGMRMQINTLSNLGLLSRFVGMLTDSRSFLSFPRHEYFRRLLCDMLGDDAASGELPDDFDLLANLVRGVCYENARGYFGFCE